MTFQLLVELNFRLMHHDHLFVIMLYDAVKVDTDTLSDPSLKLAEGIEHVPCLAIP